MDPLADGLAGIVIANASLEAVRVLLLISLLVTGCTAENCDIAPTDAAPIVLSREMPLEIQNAFVSAAAEWNAAAPVRLKVQFGDEPTVEVVDVMPYDSKKSGSCSYCERKIYVRSDVPPKWLRALVTHELGHWLGHTDHTETGLMSVGFDPEMHCIDAEAAALFGGKGTCE